MFKKVSEISTLLPRTDKYSVEKSTVSKGMMALITHRNNKSTAAEDHELNGT
jgi:hypothetical protein